MGRLRLLPAAIAPFALLASATAWAGEPTLTTREIGSWNDTLAALRDDQGSEGRVLHVVVRSDGATVPCERYRLELGAAARGAFRVGACRGSTEETEIVLEHRAGLFDERFHVARPRTLAISIVLRTTEVAGGGVDGGSIVRCSWSVRPYLDDALKGTRVMLTPEHYALRMATAWVSATPEAGGWTLSTTEKATFHLDYEVVDLATGETVLRQKTSMTCGPTPPPPETLRHTEVAPAETPEVERPRPSWSSESKTTRNRRWSSVPAESTAGTTARVFGPPYGPGPQCDATDRVQRRGCPPRYTAYAPLFGVLALAGTAAAVSCFVAGAIEHDPGQATSDQVGGGIAVVPAAVFTIVFAAAVHNRRAPPELASLRPSLAVTRQGGTFGLASSF